MVSKLSKRQLQRWIRTAASDSSRLAFTAHAQKQMRKPNISHAMVLDVLQEGLLRRAPEPNHIHGTLECRMERFVAGLELAVVVAVSDDDPLLVIITAMELHK